MPANQCVSGDEPPQVSQLQASMSASVRAVRWLCTQELNNVDMIRAPYFSTELVPGWKI